MSDDLKGDDIFELEFEKKLVQLNSIMSMDGSPSNEISNKVISLDDSRKR